MVPQKVFTYPISKLHSILAVENLLAHSNKTIIYYGQVNNDYDLGAHDYDNNYTYYQNNYT